MDNKTVLVTGASSGIGRAIAKMLHEKGYKVYGTSRSVVHKGNDLGDFKMVRLDVTCEKSVDECVSYIYKKEGRLDILVNCAGFGIAGSVEGVPIDMCQKQFDTNFFGTVRVIKRVLPIMRRQNSGHIVNIGSVAGYISIPYQSMYSSSKFALESLSETLFMEVKRFGIKVSLVEPGDTKTGFTGARQIASDAEIEKHYMPKSKKAIAQMEKDEQNGYSPRVVAKAVFNTIKRKNPPFRVNVGVNYKFVYFLSKILPGKLKLIILDWIY